MLFTVDGRRTPTQAQVPKSARIFKISRVTVTEVSNRGDTLHNSASLQNITVAFSAYSTLA